MVIWKYSPTQQKKNQTQQYYTHIISKWTVNGERTDEKNAKFYEIIKLRSKNTGEELKKASVKTLLYLKRREKSWQWETK